MTDINTLISERFGRKTDVGRGRDVEMLNKILEHRSIRKYQNKKVSEDLIETLLACAQSAPTKSDLQQYAILRLTDKKKKSRLAELSGTGLSKPHPSSWFSVAIFAVSKKYLIYAKSLMPKTRSIVL